MQKIYIGIDNGVTGSIGIIYDKTEKYDLIQTPFKKELLYTKEKQHISRLCFDKFFNILNKLKYEGDCKIMLEYPYSNKTNNKALRSGLRCFEAQLIVIEQLNFKKKKIEYIQAKEWQALYLAGIKGRENLKQVSKEYGCLMFPEIKDKISKYKDADGLFIAKYLREKNI